MTSGSSDFLSLTMYLETLTDPPDDGRREEEEEEEEVSVVVVVVVAVEVDFAVSGSVLIVGEAVELIEDAHSIWKLCTMTHTPTIKITSPLYTMPNQ